MKFLRGMYYAPDATPGGAPDTQTPAAATPVATTDNGTGGDAGKTFSQAEVDALLGDRAKRATEASTKKLLEALGVTDVAAAKALLEEAATLKQSQMTELEKAQKAAEKAQAEATAAKEAEAAALAKVSETLLRSAVLAEAGALGFHNPADAWVYVLRDKLELAEDGEVKGAKAAVEAVAKERAYLLKTAGSTTPGSPRTDRRSQPAGATPDKAPVRIGF